MKRNLEKKKEKIFNEKKLFKEKLFPLNLTAT